MDSPNLHLSLFDKALRLPLRMIPSGTRMPILRGPLRGKRWIVGSSNHRCWLGTYEYSKVKVFSAMIKRGEVVYDLGANAGYYSLLASVLVGPDGQVISFEPLPRNLTLLRRHLDLNGVRNCAVMDVAVSSLDGTAKFDSGPNPHMGHLAGDSQNALSVRTVALDGLVASGQIRPPNVIKCDIEGGELDALRGAAGILSKYSPTIFLATHGPEVHQRCCALLKDLHYQLTPLNGLPLNLTTEVLATPAPVKTI
jgi:FkbM family methyltransferase